MLTGRATGRQKCLTVYLLTGHPVCPGKYRFFQGILNEIKVTSYLRICWFVYRYYLYHSSHFVRFHFPEYGLRIGSGSSAEEVLCQIHRVAQPGQKSEEKWLSIVKKRIRKIIAKLKTTSSWFSAWIFPAIFCFVSLSSELMILLALRLECWVAFWWAADCFNSLSKSVDTSWVWRKQPPSKDVNLNPSKSVASLTNP